MIKYLVMDVDGSLTDGKVYMGPEGEVMKAFSIKDGYVVNFILKPANIRPIIITARNSKIVQNRCDELGIKEVYQGKIDKLATLTEICGEDDFGNCAYFGDDIIDLKCMNPVKVAGGIIGCPVDAVSEVKAIADYICVNKAGEGALREFVEWLISSRQDQGVIEKRVDSALQYLLTLDNINADGKKHIVNEDFYYLIQSYTTKKECECILESHKKYIDIQIIVKGEEVMGLSDISRLIKKEDYNMEKDVIVWNIPHRMAKTTLCEGDYIILYPENAHMGAISKNEETEVLKIIGKVKIE